jgi:hypothetical protein
MGDRFTKRTVKALDIRRIVAYILFSLFVFWAEPAQSLAPEKPREPLNLSQAKLRGPVQRIVGGGETLEFDPQGKLIKVATAGYGGRSPTETKYFFDDLGCHVRKDVVEDGRIAYQEAYGHDPRGYLSAVVTTDRQGNFEDVWFYFYDDRGNRIARIIHSRNGSHVVRADYAFDEKGRALTYRFFHVTNPKEGLEYRMQHDVRGYLAEEKRFSLDGEYLGYETFSYDEKGALKNWKQYDRTGVLHFERQGVCTYDTYGNWTRCVYEQHDLIREKRDTQTFERTIEYRSGPE